MKPNLKPCLCHFKAIFEAKIVPCESYPRSGGLRSVSESVAFVPELEGAPTFGDLCAAEDLSEESVKAGEMLDKVHTHHSKQCTLAAQGPDREAKILA